MIQAEKQLKCRPRGKPWPPGVSGNPAGRPKGALNKFTLAVLADKSQVESGEYGLDCLSANKGIQAKFDPRRGHEHTMTKISGQWRRTIEQDGLVFDRDT